MCALSDPTTGKPIWKALKFARDSFRLVIKDMLSKIVDRYEESEAQKMGLIGGIHGLWIVII